MCVCVGGGGGTVGKDVNKAAVLLARAETCGITLWQRVLLSMCALSEVTAHVRNTAWLCGSIYRGGRRRRRRRRPWSSGS